MDSKNVKNKMKLLIAALCMVFGLSFISAPMTVHATESEESEESDVVYDLSWLGGEGNGAFSELETQVKETGNSAYRLFMAIGGVGLLLSFIICGISIAISGGGNNRSQKLGWLLWIGLGGIVVFGSIGLVGFTQSVGGNIM